MTVLVENLGLKSHPLLSRVVEVFLPVPTKGKGRPMETAEEHTAEKAKILVLEAIVSKMLIRHCQPPGYHPDPETQKEFHKKSIKDFGNNMEFKTEDKFLRQLCEEYLQEILNDVSSWVRE